MIYENVIEMVGKTPVLKLNGFGGENCADIYVKLDGDKISDIKYNGEACVIAISSTSILSKMLVGKTLDEAKIILENYFNMIEEKEYDKEILKEANVYDDIYKQPARKTCATLFARGIGKIFNDENRNE